MAQKGNFRAFLINYLTMYRYHFVTKDFLKSPLETKTPQYILGVASREIMGKN